MIEIDEKDYSSTKWFRGRYEDSAGNEWGFSLVVDYDNPFENPRIDEIQWDDDSPGVDDKSNAVIELQIKDAFYARQ